jgi:hypothetical protein
MQRAVYGLLLSSRHIATCKLNPLPVMPLLLGGHGIIIVVFSLAAAALHKALFLGDDSVRNKQGGEAVTAPFSFFNSAMKAFACVPSCGNNKINQLGGRLWVQTRKVTCL